MQKLLLLLVPCLFVIILFEKSYRPNCKVRLGVGTGGSSLGMRNGQNVHAMSDSAQRHTRVLYSHAICSTPPSSFAALTGLIMGSHCNISQLAQSQRTKFADTQTAP